MPEVVGAGSVEVLRNPYWEMDSHSPEWKWYPEVLALFPPMEEWTEEVREDAEYAQISRWRSLHPHPGPTVPWAEAKLMLAERLVQMDDPEAQALVREWFPEGLSPTTSDSTEASD